MLHSTTSELVSADAYRKAIGRSRQWVWRMKREGLLDQVNICGKVYLTRESIEEFERKAKAGELARRTHAENINHDRRRAAKEVA
jgi:hypothetical protein